MKTLSLATALLLASTFAASAKTVTYAFKGFVEHSPGGGSTEPVDYGRIIPIRITVNTDAPGTVSGNTETYSGSASDSAADPIVSARIGSKTIPQGSYDYVVITKNSDGSSSIAISSYEVQLGGYSFSFVSSRGNAVASLAIPAKILTLDFDTSSFSSGDPVADVGGSLTTAGIPQVSSSATQ